MSSQKQKSKVLWSGRFKKQMDERLKAFSYSLLTDQELLCAELCVNEAYAQMLAKVGLITKAEAKKLVRGIRAIGKSWKPGDACRYYEDYEDIHTLIQQELEKRVGATAQKIHTGRSRNDLVVTSTRFYLKSRIRQIQSKIIEFQKSLIACAKRAGNLMVPGLTHLKKAQVILVSHHFLAYVEMLEEDRARLTDSFKRVDILALGSAALAGSSLPLDQKYLARQLGFSKIATNSLQAVSDRAFMAEVLSALAILWMHLSRLSEDMILWNNEAFRFIELDDAFATGSSLMPQKKNPDVFELVRGRSAGILGELTALIALQKGLPLAYNRDLQEDKPGFFRSIHQTVKALDVLAPVFQTLRFNMKAMTKALLDEGLYATDLLEYLVRKGVPFSQAHQTVGKIIRAGIDTGMALKQLPLREWKKFSPYFEPDILDLFDAAASVKSKKTIGSTHPARVRSEIQKWEKELGAAARSLKSFQAGRN